jgi:hypothetical protein
MRKNYKIENFKLTSFSSIKVSAYSGRKVRCNCNSPGPLSQHILDNSFLGCTNDNDQACIHPRSSISYSPAIYIFFLHDLALIST